MLLLLSRGFIALCMSIMLYSSSAVASDDDDINSLRSPLGHEWLLTKDDRLRNIKTYVRLEDGKQYRSFKIEAILNASMQTVVNVLFDFENFPKWYWKTRSSRLLEQKSNTEFILYFIHEAPQGLADRDVVLQCTIEPQTKTKRALTLKVVALPNFLPAKPPLIRMPAEDMSIKFLPLANGKIQLEAEGYFDAGGTAVPTWATNFIQRAAPYVVVRNLQRQLNREEYRHLQKQAFAVYDDHDY